jgi:hypothetical protein
MSGGSTILGPWPSKDAAVDPVAAVSESQVIDIGTDHAPLEYYDDDDEPLPTPILKRFLVGALVLVTIAWVGLAGYTQYIALGGRVPNLAEITNFVALMCAPLALIGVMWLLVQRSSQLGSQRISKNRFGAFCDCTPG